MLLRCQNRDNVGTWLDVLVIMMTVDEEEATNTTDIEDKAKLEAGMEIPHNSVHLEGDILSNHRTATDLVQAMTHDLHTPLNVIMGMCQLLERDPERALTPTQQDAVDRIDRNAHALLKTVDDLLGQLKRRL